MKNLIIFLLIMFSIFVVFFGIGYISKMGVNDKEISAIGYQCLQIHLKDVAGSSSEKPYRDQLEKSFADGKITESEDRKLDTIYAEWIQNKDKEKIESIKEGLRNAMTRPVKAEMEKTKWKT